MSQKNISTVAIDVIATYGVTATNIINSYRFGGERVAGFVDRRFAAVVSRGGAAFRKDLRSNLIESVVKSAVMVTSGRSPSVSDNVTLAS